MERRMILVLSILALVAVKAQENAQTRIPQTLMECYSDHNLMQRENRLPMTMNTLIDLIRKAENDVNGKNMDIRMMTVSLLHRFRLDGIVKASKISQSANVVPYSPQGYQFYKHKLLLTNLIPDDRTKFPNASLTSLEKCSLHHMISNTVEEKVRGDEGQVCNRLSQYRTLRLPRSAPTRRDVEVLDKDLVNKMNLRGNLRMLSSDEDNDKTIPIIPKDVDTNIQPGTYNNNEPSERSQCPVEDGVVYTLWGAVSAGTLLAGIATGLQPQRVTLRDIWLQSGTGPEGGSERDNLVIDNIYGATLAGDLAEVVLRQGPTKSSQEGMNIGGAGGWNSTLMPKWYFLSKWNEYEMTDAEIRAGLDGLVLATHMREFTSKAPNLKLSQILDMYYSQRGVYSSETLRACNRQSLLNQVAPPEILEVQTLGFSYLLDKSMQMDGTITASGFKEFTLRAANSLREYIPKTLNDLTCSSTAVYSTNYNVDTNVDLHVVLDASWPHNSIAKSISYLVDNVNVAHFGSNITLMNAKDGRAAFDSTQSLGTFFENYNATVQQAMPTGIELPKVMERLKANITEKMEREKETSFHGGKSIVILMVLNSAFISDADINYVVEDLKIYSEEMPDVKFLYLVNGNKEKFNSLVKDAGRDIFSISLSTENTAPEMNKVISRIKEVPRRLVNNRCGSKWDNTDLGVSTLSQSVAPSMIHYYRLHPNYFFKSDNAKIKIKGQGTLNFCFSRDVENPKRSNITSSNKGVECYSVTSNEQEVTLSGACNRKSYIHKCAPYYFSVEGVTTSTSFNCQDKHCRFPDSIKYTIDLQDLGCYSSGNRYLINAFALIASVVFTMRRALF